MPAIVLHSIMADLRSLAVRTLLLLLPLAAALGSGGPLLAATDLPDIGSPANAMLPKSEEARIGRAIMRELRNRGAVVDDPLITEYIEAVGHRLVAHANEGEQSFEFFVVDDPSINAFALPGGFIGVHTGLIEATESESELAGVLAHEIAHVTQRHIARSIYKTSRANIITLATMLGAILVGMAADGGGDATQGAIMGAQGMMVQNRINFTRRNEYEADRVGVATMAAAGFDPQGMPDFFATIGRRAGPFASSVPEFLRTHPVSSNRIAETRARAASGPSWTWACPPSPAATPPASCSAARRAGTCTTAAWSRPRGALCCSTRSRTWTSRPRGSSSVHSTQAPSCASAAASRWPSTCASSPRPSAT